MFRLTEEEVKAIIMAYKDLPDELKVTHMLIRKPTGSSEIEAMWDVLARESETEDVAYVNETPEQSSVAGDKPESQVYLKTLTCQ